MKDKIFNITNQEQKNELINFIKEKKPPFHCFIGKYEGAKTRQQLGYYNALIGEFSRVMCSYDLSDYTVGDWDAEIKRTAKFYQTNTGCARLPRELKIKLNNVLRKNFNKFEYSLVIETFNEQTLKSKKDATVAELSNLITVACIVIINNLTSSVECLRQNDPVKYKDFTIKNILQQESKFTDLLFKWYEDFMSSEVFVEDENKDICRERFENLAGEMR